MESFRYFPFFEKNIVDRDDFSNKVTDFETLGLSSFITCTGNENSLWLGSGDGNIIEFSILDGSFTISEIWKAYEMTVFDIKYCQAKGKGLFGGYMYYEIENGSDTYKIYDVNQGTKGRNFCIYLNEQLIAIAKFTHLGYSGAIYTIYSENNIDPHILTILIMFSDAVILRNNDGQSALFVVLPKEIKNKYDSTFVDKIITQDGQ